MFDYILNAINDRLPDNTTGLITPAVMRQTLSDIISQIGINSNFLGFAPLTNPNPTPDGKCWYITDPRRTSFTAATYTGYGSDFTVKVGMVYIVFFDGTWHWCIIERDFQNANYGSGKTIIQIPETPTTPTPLNPRRITITSDVVYVDHVVSMTLDGEEITPTDTIEILDSDSHTVTVMLDNTYSDTTPPCFNGIDAQSIELPYGIASYDQPTGTATTHIILPASVTSITAQAITAASAQRLTLTGPPPTLDPTIDWSNIQSLTIPTQYSILYSNSPDWVDAIEAVETAGGSVITPSGSSFAPYFYIDTDGTLGGAAASDEAVASQKAVKEYADTTGLHYISPVTTAGASSSPYLSVKWQVDDVDGITTPTDGMRVACRVNRAGFGSSGVLLSIDGGTTWHPVVVGTRTLFYNQHPVNSSIVLVYNATQTADGYSSASATAETFTGVWQVASAVDKDENVRQTPVSGDNQNLRLLLTPKEINSTVIGEATYNTGVYFNPSTNKLTAPFFAGDGRYLTDLPATNPTSHTHGNIQNGGTLQTNDITVATGDKLVVTDASDSDKVARASLSFDTTNQTSYLRKDGVFATLFDTVAFTVTDDGNGGYTVSGDYTPTQVKALIQAGRSVAAVLNIDGAQIRTTLVSVMSARSVLVLFQYAALGFAVVPVLGDTNDDTWAMEAVGCKISQTEKADPVASGETTECIDSITQNANGEITATKKTVYTYDMLHDPRYSWRTPTKDEWGYLLNTRSASTVNGVANARYAKCTVNGVNGLLILPDVFTLPNGLTMANINTANAAFTGNAYTLEQWELLKAAGGAFLPACGYRSGSGLRYAGSCGSYWHASLCESYPNYAWGIYFNSGYQGVSSYDRYYGLSVRAVRSHENGAFSLSASTKADIAPANLQYHCKENRWRFAPNAYDYIGAANANAAAGYDGWIDLFGWGTSGWDGSQANAKMPYSTSNNNTHYYPDGDGTHDLTGDYARADWAVFASKGNQADADAVYAIPTIPTPTAADSGKLLMVNATGNYELMTITNAETTEY